MSFLEKSFSGQIFRPRPEIFLDKNGELFIVATPWGNRQSAKRAVQILQDYYLAARQDAEATSPFEHMSCLSHLANTVRIGIKLVNDALYNEENKEEFTSGLEIFVLAATVNEVAWAHVGNPFVLLDRPGRPLISLSSQFDLSTEFSNSPQALAPLPNHLVGIDSQLNVVVESLKPSRGDRFILLSRSSVPAEVFSLSSKERNLESISKVLAKDSSDLPFWLGIHDFTALERGDRRSA